MPALLASGESHVPGLQTATFSVSSRDRETECVLRSLPHYKDTNPLMESHPHDLRPPKALPPNTIRGWEVEWGVRPTTYILGGAQTLVHKPSSITAGEGH